MLLALRELLVQLAVLGPSVRLDHKVPLACKDLKATLALLVLSALLERLALRATQVPQVLRDLLAQQGRKALPDLLDQLEDSAADKNFRAAALSLSWCQLESTG